MADINMSASNISVLFSLLLIGGLLPSVSSLVVFSRAATSGFVHGAFTSMGIVLGDIIFILIAIYGLTILAQSVGSLFVLIKFLGAGYLIWLGTIQWQTKLQATQSKKTAEVSLLSSFLTGLFITLADQKAILFYIGFFPALFDLTKITLIDTSMIIVITTLTLGSAKLCYAIMGRRAIVFINHEKTITLLNKVVGSFMVAVGSYIMLTATAT